MFTHPYSIYTDKRPIRIAFLVDPSPESIETVDQIIDYNRGLWGGRYNPIILTDGNTIGDRWWQFLRDVDPDIIKSLVPLSIDLIEKFEKFLSPMAIENFQGNEPSDLGTRVNPRIDPAGIDVNSLNFSNLGGWYGKPVIGTFNVEEMDDHIGKLFARRNFGISLLSNWAGGWDAFSIPSSLETALSRGEVPLEIHEGFKEKELDKAGIPLSKEAFSKRSTQYPEKWAIIDQENNRIHHVKSRNDQLFVWPYRQNSDPTPNEIEKKVYLVTNRENLAEALSQLSQNQNIVCRDQICAFPNTERELEKFSPDWFEVIVGDTLQEIVHFWNRPWLLSRSKRKYMNQLWLPTALATDPIMEDALCSWINRNTWKKNGNPKTVYFVSFSGKDREIEDIASKFQITLGAFTHAKHYVETQIPSLAPEHLSFFLGENPLFSRDSNIDIHRAQGNTDILELTEPNGLAQHDLDGHWMADFYIEFTHDRYGNKDDIIKRIDGDSLLWKLPNRNHLADGMFSKSSRIRQNGFPSALMKKGDQVLRLTLKGAESVVASLFYSNNRFVYKNNDPRVQIAAAPYNDANVSDKGKYLQGVLELFGNLTFAYEVFRNPYWRSMFDILSKNLGAEQNMKETVSNTLRKLINRSDPLTSTNQRAIESLTARVVNHTKNLVLKQKEVSFDRFMSEAETWREKFIDGVKSTGNHSERDLIGYGFRREDIEKALSELTQRNIIQIGVRPRCRSCGIANWYHVDDIGQQLTCQGCRILFSLDPESPWQYRLNSLVHAAYAFHGITPVILVLGQLLNDSGTSFLFSPNLNLLVRPQDELSEELETVAEVDIACIRDGKFIIGEVKQSMRLFNKNDFDDMTEIAKRVKPDIVLFSCVDQQHPSDFITEQIARIKSKLSPLEVDVMWYQLDALDYSDSV